jgi:hypothetical protein
MHALGSFVCRILLRSALSDVVCTTNALVRAVQIGVGILGFIGQVRQCPVSVVDAP